MILEDKRFNYLKPSNFIVDALKYDHLDIVNILLNHPEIDISANNNELLDMAVSKGYIDLVDRLLKDKRLMLRDLNNVLANAAIKGHINIINRFLKEPKISRNIHEIVVLVAAGKGYIDIVKRLLEDQRVIANFANILRDIGSLQFGKNSEIILRMILEHPSANLSNYRIIIDASKNGNIDAINISLENPNVDPSVRDNEAIKEAAKSGQIHVVEKLLRDNRVVDSLTPGQLETYKKMSQ